jgi:hypothetical protein
MSIKKFEKFINEATMNIFKDGKTNNMSSIEKNENPQEKNMKYLLDYKLFEEDSNIDLEDELNQIGKGLEAKGEDMQDLILKLAQSDPDMKKKLDDRKGKEDGGNQEEEKEVNEGLLLGAALSSGAVLEMVGKFLKFIGKKVSKDDESRIFKIGANIEKYGHNIHHKIITLINTILKPLIFWMSKENQKKVSNVVFMVVITIKLTSGSFDPTDYKTAAQMTEGLLNTIKGTEIASFIKDYGKNLLQFVKAL